MKNLSGMLDHALEGDISPTIHDSILIPSGRFRF